LKKIFSRKSVGVGYLLLATPMNILLILVLDWSGLANIAIGHALLAFIACLIMTGASKSSFFKKSFSEGSIERAALFAFYPLTLIILFPVLYRSFYNVLGENFFLMGLVDHIMGVDHILVDWIWYMTDNVGRTLMYNKFEFFFVNLFRIADIDAFWPEDFIWVFRVVLALGFVKLMMNFFKSFKTKTAPS
jgi:hypothetical protein